MAIVGLGPKGLYALERLIAHLAAASGHAPVEVVVFEPHPQPGAGPVYDPRQPEYLLMNFASRHVDMWAPGGEGVPADERLDLATWLRRGEPGAEISAYVPRALVGGYLSDGLERMLPHASHGVRVSVRPERVVRVRRAGPRWTVTTPGGGVRRGFDEVLIAVGHRPAGADTPLARSWRHAAPLVPAVFPTERWLSPERVPPRARVAMRGFALTWIDATLSLFEGRGGGFSPGGRPGRLRYRAGPEEVGVIAPFSRTGRPMLAKPDPGPADAVPGVAAIVAAGRVRLRRRCAAGRLAVRGGLVPELAATAAQLLAAARGGRAGLGRQSHLAATMTSWLDRRTASGGGGPSGDPVRELTRSLDVGLGARTPDARWAIGEAWRGLYPEIVAAAGHGGVADREWPGFARLAAEMERLAFGPPPVNAAKMLALMEAGRVDLRHVAGGRLRSEGGRTRLCSGRGTLEVDVVVDAVLPPPGAAGADDDLIAALVTDGLVRVASGGRRGLEVRPDAGCVGPSGSVTPGLSAIGRPTEDWVIGNDTLSRTLHPHADRWARRVVWRAARPGRSDARPRLVEPVAR